MEMLFIDMLGRMKCSLSPSFICLSRILQTQLTSKEKDGDLSCGEMRWSLVLCTNAHVRRTSFIHADRRYFAASPVISESIKSTGFETINYEKRQKYVVHQHACISDAESRFSVGGVCHLNISITWLYTRVTVHVTWRLLHGGQCWLFGHCEVQDETMFKSLRNGVKQFI